MVKLNKIYTRTGDDGTTGLVSGPRRLKHDLRVEAYGTIDEANSAIGIARLHSHGMPVLDTMLMRDPERPVRSRRRPVDARHRRAAGIGAAADHRDAGRAARA